MTGSHFGLEVVAHAEGGNNGVEEYGRLCHLGLTEVFVRAVEHDISNAISKDIIGIFKQFFGQSRVLVQVFAHSYELGALARKYKCFHLSKLFGFIKISFCF